MNVPILMLFLFISVLCDKTNASEFVMPDAIFIIGGNKTFLKDIRNIDKVDAKNDSKEEQKPKERETILYQDLLKNLRDSWQMPSDYLEERGYLNKRTPKKLTKKEEKSSKQNETQIEVSSKNAPKHNSKRRLSNHKKFFYFRNANRNGGNHDYFNENQDYSKKDDSKELQSEGLSLEQSNSANETFGTTTKPGFFENVKKKISNLFSKNKSASVDEDFDPFGEMLKPHGRHTKRQSNEYLNFKYDNAWPNDEKVDKFNFNTPAELLQDFQLSNLVGKKEQTVKNSKNKNVVANSNYSDLFKNLSKCDVILLKQFLKCFKENKNDLVKVVETKNTTHPPSNGNMKVVISVPESNSNSTSNSTNRETVAKPSVETGSCKNSNETVENPKEQPKLEKERETSCNHYRYDNKLKFLAHIHHSVLNVGKRPHKPLDLKKVQQVIDEVRYNFGLNIPGDADQSNKTTTTCNRGQANEMNLSIGLEKFKRSNTDLGFVTKNDAESAENDYDYLDEDHGENYFNPDPGLEEYYPVELEEFANLNPDDDEDPKNVETKRINKSKRQISISQGQKSDQNIEKVLSDVSSSLKKFAGGNKDFQSFDEYYGDYLNIDREKKKAKNFKFAKDQEFYQNYDENFKKHRKRKRKKNPHPDLDDSSSNFDQTEKFKRIYGPNFIIKDEQKLASSNPKVETPSNEVNDINEFSPFSELNDIKFRVNQEEEEAINSFIQSLNSPPEIFNFDVNKFIREKSLQPELIPIDAQPERTFYEFLDVPKIENEKVPFIEKGTPLQRTDDEVSKSLRDFHFDKNIANKRDLLRQYIKGISENILNTNSLTYQQIAGPKDNGKDIRARSNQGKEDQNGKIESLSEPRFICNDDLDLSSYDTNSLNGAAEQKENSSKENDDFVDKFYLLNDGNFKVWGADKIKENYNGKFDANALNIDLDLDKQFQDLKLQPVQQKEKDEPETLNQKTENNDKNSMNGYNNMNLIYIPKDSKNPETKSN